MWDVYEERVEVLAELECVSLLSGVFLRRVRGTRQGSRRGRRQGIRNAGYFELGKQTMRQGASSLEWKPGTQWLRTRGGRRLGLI